MNRTIDIVKQTVIKHLLICDSWYYEQIKLHFMGVVNCVWINKICMKKTNCLNMFPYILHCVPFTSLSCLLCTTTLCHSLNSLMVNWRSMWTLQFTNWYLRSAWNDWKAASLNYSVSLSITSIRTYIGEYINVFLL